MLERNPTIDPLVRLRAQDDSGSTGVSIADLFDFVRRYAWTIIVPALLCTALAVAIAYNSPKRFTAVSRLIIDTPKGQFFEESLGMKEGSLSAAQTDSEVEVIRSEKIAEGVIQRLDLANDPEFGAEGGGILAWTGESLRELLGIDQRPELTDFERTRIAIDSFLGNLDVLRIGQTFVIEISFRSLYPEKAARIANAVADAYIQERLDAKLDATKRGGEWLQGRTAELRAQLNAASKAVQDFKTENSIIGGGSRGLIDEQHLSELNTQLVTAQGQTAEARARLERISNILDGSIPDATVTDTLKSPIINSLRQRYLDAAARRSDLASRFGELHLVVVTLRNEMRELQKAISDELKRTAETFKSDYEIAKAREQALSDGLQKLIGNAGVTGQKQVMLGELESSSQTYRTIYETFLQKYTEAVQQQSFPLAEARIITAATRPLAPSHPRTKLMVLAGAMVGCTLGIGAAFLRSGLDRGIRSSKHVAQKLGVDCLGVLPRMKHRGLHAGPGFREIITAPFSAYSEGLREVKTSLDVANIIKPARLIGVVSILPDEGKSTLTSNLAHLVAASGKTTLLIDGDVRNNSLTRALAPKARQGLVEALAGRAVLRDVISTDGQQDFHFLPAAKGSLIPNSGDLLSSEAMLRLLDGAKNVYDYVFIDFPPMRAMPDARALAPFLDAVIIVVEWGATSAELVRDAIAALEAAQTRVLGVVLNKADPKLARSHEAYGVYYASGESHR